jgi:hypothetical protein
MELMTAAFIVFAKAVSGRKEIPFKITARPMTNDMTRAGLGSVKKYE